MGHKVHPTGIRLGISKDWNSKWYAGKKEYAGYLEADLKVREGEPRVDPAGLFLAERDVGREGQRPHAEPEGLGEREEASDHR